jgi:uncharacterized membrane protein
VVPSVLKRPLDRPLAFTAGLARSEPALLLLVAFAATGYATYSVLNHMHFGTYAYDLGIFDQVMWHYSRFEIPETTVVGLPTALGDHFHPILLLLTPLYWVWSDPRILLVAQAILIAVSIVPVFIWCRERVGRGPAYLLAGAYVMFWGVHSAVAFDFHEIAFAPVLLASLLIAADRGQWRAFGALVVALLLVKENLALLVVFIGLYVAIVHGERRRGMIAAGVAIGWFFLTTKLLIPWFGGGRGFRHFRYQQFGSDLPEALGHMLRYPWTVFEVFVDQDAKVRTLILLFAPFLALIFLSPLAILLIPLLAERMYSTNPFLWGTSAHYSLVIAPVLVMGTADGLARLMRRLPAERRHRARGYALACTWVIFVVNVGAAGDKPLRALTDPEFYSRSSADDIASRMVSLVPPGATVAAQSHFVPHLSQRQGVFQLGPGKPTAEYIVANSGLDFQLRYPDLRYVDKRRLLRDRADRYGPVFYEDGWVVLRRYPDDLADVAAGKRRPRTPG